MKTNKRNLLITIMLLSLFMLMGCGPNKAEEEFKASLNSFYENVDKITISINNIDPYAANANEQMLTSIDSINDEFNKLAELEVPSKYSEVASQIGQSINNMNESNRLYHEAFATDVTNEASLANAQLYYNNALQGIRNVGELLMGHELVTEEE